MEQPPVVASSTRSTVIKAVSALAAVALVAVVASSSENPLLQAELPGTPASTTLATTDMWDCLPNGRTKHGWACTTASTLDLMSKADVDLYKICGANDDAGKGLKEACHNTPGCGLRNGDTCLPLAGGIKSVQKCGGNSGLNRRLCEGSGGGCQWAPHRGGCLKSVHRRYETAAATTQMHINPCIGGTNGHGWDC